MADPDEQASRFIDRATVAMGALGIGVVVLLDAERFAPSSRFAFWLVVAGLVAWGASLSVANRGAVFLSARSRRRWALALGAVAMITLSVAAFGLGSVVVGVLVLAVAGGSVHLQLRVVDLEAG